MREAGSPPPTGPTRGGLRYAQKATDAARQRPAVVGHHTAQHSFTQSQCTIRVRGVSVPVCGCPRTRNTRTAGEVSGTHGYGPERVRIWARPQKPVLVRGPYPWVPRADSAQFYGSGSVKPGTIVPRPHVDTGLFLKKRLPLLERSAWRFGARG